MTEPADVPQTSASVPVPIPGLAFDAAPPPVPPAAAGPRTLDIRFTGSGSEYFRIWSVNLLLILVTLGLYLPFAKARRIRYFYANTWVDGQALSFHGDPWKMFRGFVLLAVLMGAYAGAGQLSPVAAVVAFLILCAVWPALWRASLQFRLANTGWRGLRLRFEGSLKSAYLAFAPVYLPVIVIVACSRLMAPEASDVAPDGPAVIAAGFVVIAAALAVLALSPWSTALLKRYQHDGYRIAAQRARLALTNGQVYLLALQTLGLVVGAVLAWAVLIGLLLAGLHLFYVTTPVDSSVLGLLPLVGTLLIYLLVLPFSAAHMQNLAWNGTYSQALDFHSRLRFRELFTLTLANWLLTALTLGLYRPFAAVRTARLRLEAVSVRCTEDPADWIAVQAPGHADATGDIAGDFFGIDIGL